VKQAQRQPRRLAQAQTLPTPTTVQGVASMATTPALTVTEPSQMVPVPMAEPAQVQTVELVQVQTVEPAQAQMVEDQVQTATTPQAQTKRTERETHIPLRRNTG
jgi:hypothetical protein